MVQEGCHAPQGARSSGGGSGPLEQYPADHVFRELRAPQQQVGRDETLRKALLQAVQASSARPRVLLTLWKRAHAIARRSFDEDQDGPPAKRSRRSTARAMESAELEAMDVFGDKEDEEDR